MNKVFSINEPTIINGEDMKPGDFGIIRAGDIKAVLKEGNHIIKTDEGTLVCLENGDESSNPDLYEVELKDHLKLQRIK